CSPGWRRAATIWRRRRAAWCRKSTRCSRRCARSRAAASPACPAAARPASASSTIGRARSAPQMPCAGRVLRGGRSARRPARHDRAVHRFRARRAVHRAGQGGARARRARRAGDRSVRRSAAVLPPGRGLSGRRLRRDVVPGDVILTVVDPGVGGARAALALQADGRWYVGPNNGVFELVLRRAKSARCWRIDWRPKALSATFHGRDLFAPVAALLAQSEAPLGKEAPATRYPKWPDDLTEIAYVDRYGNAITGMRAAVLPEGTELEVAGVRIARARTFGDVPPRGLLWYANANGLAEIAANGASAAATLGLAPGSPVAVHGPG